MRRYVLNTSFGAYSAGTEVDIRSATGWGKKDVVGIHPVNSHPSVVIDVPATCLTLRRDRTDLIAKPTREERRKELRTVWELMNRTSDEPTSSKT